jgi:hypothetical protein
MDLFTSIDDFLDTDTNFIIAFCFGTKNSLYLPLIKKYIYESFCKESNIKIIYIFHFDKEFNGIQIFTTEYEKEIRIYDIFIELNIQICDSFESNIEIAKTMRDGNIEKIKKCFEIMQTVISTNKYCELSQHLFNIINKHKHKIKKCIFYNELFSHSKIYSEEDKIYYTIAHGVYYELIPQIINLAQKLNTENIIDNNIFLLFIHSYKSQQKEIITPLKKIYSSIAHPDSEKILFSGLYHFPSFNLINRLNHQNQAFLEFVSDDKYIS